MNNNYICYNLILRVLLITILIGLFIFIYVSKISKIIISNESEFVINDTMHGLNLLLPMDISNYIKKYINNYKLPNMNQHDQNIKNNNKSIMNNIYLFLTIIFSIGIICFSSIYYFNNNIDIKNILIENVILLIFIYIIMYIFTNIIALNYKFIDPNFIKYTILNTVYKFSL